MTILWKTVKCHHRLKPPSNSMACHSLLLHETLISELQKYNPVKLSVLVQIGNHNLICLKKKESWHLTQGCLTPYIRI